MLTTINIDMQNPFSIFNDLDPEVAMETGHFSGPRKFSPENAPLTNKHGRGEKNVSRFTVPGFLRTATVGPQGRFKSAPDVDIGRCSAPPATGASPGTPGII